MDLLEWIYEDYAVFQKFESTYWNQKEYTVQGHGRKERGVGKLERLMDGDEGNMGWGN